MSVTSVRRAVAAALADKKLTLAEAENITAIAGRTDGISASEKKEIAKALTGRARFAAGAKEHLAANAVSSFSSTTVASLEQLFNARGLDVLSGLKDADEDTFSPALKAAIDQFSKAGYQDEFMLSSNAKTLTVGREKLIVVPDVRDDGKGELIAVFNSKGEEIAVVSTKQKDDGVSMKWERLGGKAKKTPIGTPSQHPVVNLSSAEKRALAKFVTDSVANGADMGKLINEKALPAEVRRHADLMARVIADGTATEKIEFQGKTFYALWDNSCVATVYVYSGDGRLVASESN